ncbi:hypothetical protein WN943_006546 [Citrus x changshan-huyou]|uniref:Uncharacterized protein n=1 Tax=Citrus unshiu TaxID=55188 RepID=A0A2H5PWV6_CITUN|nr:hypothetical protein CUMW_175050 [Citrus unshiu]
MRPGGVYDYRGNQRSVEIKGLVRFAVQEHNKKKIKCLSRVCEGVKGKGIGSCWQYYLTLSSSMLSMAFSPASPTLMLNEAVKDCAKFELHLKLRRGSEGERHWVEIIKNSEGKFYLK